MDYITGNIYTNLASLASIPQACAQLFRLYWGSSAQNSRRFNERGKPASQMPSTAEAQL